MCRVNLQKASREECNYMIRPLSVFNVLNQRNLRGFKEEVGLLLTPESEKTLGKIKSNSKKSLRSKNKHRE